MMLYNDNHGCWADGSVGKVLEIDDEGLVEVILYDGRVEGVIPHTWHLSCRYDKYNKEH